LACKQTTWETDINGRVMLKWMLEEIGCEYTGRIELIHHKVP
jgi:hypothetical protein